MKLNRKSFKNKNVWTPFEHERMLEFLNQNTPLLIDYMKKYIKQSLRTNKKNFYIRMSNFIGSKSPIQCKSRYQKKEIALLKSVQISKKLIDNYLQSKRFKNANILKTSVLELDLTEDTQLMDTESEQKELDLDGIHSFSQLRNVILLSFLPKIQNDVIKSHLELFVNNLPSDNQIVQDIKCTDILWLCKIQPQLSFSLQMIRDKNSISTDESN